MNELSKWIWNYLVLPVEKKKGFWYAALLIPFLFNPLSLVTLSIVKMVLDIEQ